MAPDRSSTPIIAKLERPDALDNLEEIITNADGVMVARGDLGVEMPAETVPIAQKRIIESANCHARMVITATQMLDSMIKNPRPTRAEASDVANAIFDGSDAVMLSGETAAGLYPIQAVETMNAIACQAEANLTKWGHWKGPCNSNSDLDDAYFVTLAAKELAHDRNVAAIAVFTQSGRTARLMSKTRPTVPILAFTPNESTYNRMAMYWGVNPHLVNYVDTLEDMLKVVETIMIASTPIVPGQQVVVICGYPMVKIRPTNLALLYTVGETL
jgi:pyruvate kinase